MKYIIIYVESLDILDNNYYVKDADPNDVGFNQVAVSMFLHRVMELHPITNWSYAIKMSDRLPKDRYTYL